MNNYSKDTRLYYLIAFIIFALLILFNYYTFPYADDFNRLFFIPKKGPLAHQIWMYKTENGRSLSIFELTFTYLIYIFRNVKLVNLFWTLILFLTGYSLLLLYESYLDIKKNDKFLLTVFFTGILWILFRPILHQVVYWATGGIYTFKLFVFLLWIYFLEKDKYRGVLYLLAFFIGSTSLQYFLPFLVYLSFRGLYDIILKKLTLKKLLSYFIMLLTFALGELYVGLAPGNKVRMQVEGFGLSSSLIHILQNYFYLLNKYYVNYKIYILLSSISIVLIIYLFKKDDLKNRLYPLLYSFRWLFVALTFIIDFSLFEKAYQPLRVTQIFALSMTLFIVEIFLYLLIRIKDASLIVKISEYKREILVVIGVFIIMFITGVLSRQIIFYKEVTSTYNYLKTRRGKDAIVCPFNKALSPFDYPPIITATPSWRNRAIKRYFGLKSIKVAMLENCDKKLKYKYRSHYTSLYKWINKTLTRYKKRNGDIKLSFFSKISHKYDRDSISKKNLKNTDLN